MPASSERSASREAGDRRSRDSGHRRDRRDYDKENERRRERRTREDDDDEDYDRRHRHRRRRDDRSSDDSDRDVDSSRRREQRRRHRSRSRDNFRQRRHSRSPEPKRRKRSYSRSRSPAPRRSRAPLPSQNDSFRGEKGIQNGSAPPPPEKQKPNFKPTGLLAKEANTVAGTTTVLKYHEPPEARKPSPKDQWRMYVFKGKDLLDTIYLHQRSCWLFGRDKNVTDMFLEHPSISKQHAVVQFRNVERTNEYGDRSSRVKPYLIDLESANGTKLNGERVEASRYLELRDGDVVGFGDSEREYVLMLPKAE